MFRSVPREKTPMTAVRKPWLAFSVVLAAAMMDLLDSTIASVAAPAIRTEVGGSYADLQWITVAYTLAMAVMLLPGGRLGDMFGRRRMLLGGVAGFTLASAACAAAPSIGVLVGCRALQGACGAIMLPQVFGLIREIFVADQMGKAFAVLGPVAGLSAILGPVVAGLLIDADLFGSGWRAIFLVNLPVGAFVVLAGAKLLPAAAPAARGLRLDLVGAALAAAGLALLVYPLVQGRELGWPLWSEAMLAGSFVVLAGFGAHQLRRKRAGAAPLVEPGIFANRSYVSGILFALVFLGSMGGITLVLTVLLQVGLGYTPIHASLTTAPFALGGFVGSAVGGTQMQRLGRRSLHIGLALFGAGLVVLYFVLAHAGAAASTWDFPGPLFLAGIGMGMVWVPLFEIILGGVAEHEVGSASAVLQAVQSLGMSVGIAALGTLFFALLGAHADRTLDFVSAAQLTTLVTAGLVALAFAIGFLLPRAPRVHAAPVLA
jgi:EmrB/QacA subfamily drug resistance transporter